MKATAFVVDKVENGFVVQIVFDQQNKQTYVFSTLKQVCQALKDLGE